MKSATLNDLPQLYYKSDNSKMSSPHRPLARPRLYPLPLVEIFNLFIFFAAIIRLAHVWLDFILSQ